MLVAQQVNDFIRSRYPNAVCDACIWKAMDFTSHADAAQITGALGTTPDFDRQEGECSICKNEKRIVTRATRP